jgi:hypothetical protein
MAKSDPNLLTQAEYARSRNNRGLPGGSRESVRKAIERKHISAFGPDKLLDKALADSQWERNTRARTSPTAAASATNQMAMVPSGNREPLTESIASSSANVSTAADPSYMQFRMRREEADAQIAEMNAGKMRGSMLMRQDVDRAMFDIGREVRDRLTACARRIASEVASIDTAEACEAVVDREHRIVLELLVTAFREKIGTHENSDNKPSTAR